MRRLGVHTSIAGGIHLSLKRARLLGCTTMQIFVHNPRGWKIRQIKNEEIAEFRRLAEQFDIKPIFIHSSYLVNLASSERDIRRRSIELLSYEIRIANIIGVEYIVLHPGKAGGQSLKVAIRHASEGLRIAYEKAQADSVGVLLENTAGQRGDISSSISSLAEIIEGTPQGVVRGICLDSCHAYQAGYDITTPLGLKRLKREIKKYLSPLEVKLIHLNDSKRAFNSKVDRHQHIGKGEIGINGFKEFLSFSHFKDIPLILETPVEHKGDDARNLQRARKILMEIETDRNNDLKILKN